MRTQYRTILTVAAIAATLGLAAACNEAIPPEESASSVAAPLESENVEAVEPAVDPLTVDPEATELAPDASVPAAEPAPASELDVAPPAETTQPTDGATPL